MSTLQVATLLDSAGKGQQTMAGSAKVWANLNGSTSTLRKSFNVSSVTDNGTGDFTFNLTSAMADADGAPATSNGGDINLSGNRNIYHQAIFDSVSTILRNDFSTVQTDMPYATVSAQGDLA